MYMPFTSLQSISNEMGRRNVQGQSKEEREKQIAAAKANSECRACHQRGHWEGDEVCPKYDPSKPKKKGRVCDVNMVEFELEHEYVMSEALVFAAAASKGEGFRCEEAVGIIDSVCQQTVMGLTPFVVWEKCLKEKGTIEPSDFGVSLQVWQQWTIEGPLCGRSSDLAVWERGICLCDDCSWTNTIAAE